MEIQAQEGEGREWETGWAGGLVAGTGPGTAVLNC